MDDIKLKLPVTKESLKSFEYNYKKDKQSGIQRYSNRILHTLESLDGNALRFYKFICDNMNLYPLELLEDDEFLDCMDRGEKVLYSKYRTVKLSASAYAERFYPDQLRNGRKCFLQHAVKLYETEIEAQKLSRNGDYFAFKSLRILSSISFIILRKSDGVMVEEKLTIKDIVAGKAGQAAEIIIELNDVIALQSMFMQRNFTLINHHVSSLLSAKSEKLYCSLKMLSKISPVSTCLSVENNIDTFVKEASLNYWNEFFGTSHKTIRRLIDSFKVHIEIREKTEIYASIEGFSSKGGKQNDMLRVSWYVRGVEYFDILSASVQQTVVPTRKLKRRPPKIKTGTALEGDWASANIKILLNYELELKRITRKLPLADLRRLNRYYLILGHGDLVRSEGN